jgi:hypothetical protein
VNVRKTGQSLDLLLSIVERLGEWHIDYVVIGALAAAVHGVVRASMDADALVQATAQELADLQVRLRGLGYVSELRRGDADDPIGAMLQISDASENRVDLLAGLRGLDRGAWLRAVVVPFESSALRVVGREDFIAMKVFAGGPVDLSDARRAIAVDRESLNISLTLKLAKQFGEATLRGCQQLLEQADSTT